MSNLLFIKFVKFVQELYNTTEFIPLHSPQFRGNEKKYLNECIDSTFVSSVGKFVDKFEEKIAEYTGAKYAVATSNGTSALHIALLIANVQKNDEVITQPVTFVATCNAISYCGASPVFVDVDIDTMGLSPSALQDFLDTSTTVKNNQCVNNLTGKVIKACVPMHTFGNPCRIDEIKDICDKYHVCLIEDAAESLGSLYKNQHTGTFGAIGVMSFNGNKIITAGGGGCIITNDEDLAKKAKHLTTTAKVPHKWEFVHDQIGYNYRMPNLNAALILAQLEQLDIFVENKRLIHDKYRRFFKDFDIELMTELKGSKSNYWLNSLVFQDCKQKNIFLNKVNSEGVMTRPIWTLMNKLDMFKDCQSDSLRVSNWLEERVVNIPSGVFNIKDKKNGKKFKRY
jgi:aminotransferase in exopolysaccharide biosynthesis